MLQLWCFGEQVGLDPGRRYGEGELATACQAVQARYQALTPGQQWRPGPGTGGCVLLCGAARVRVPAEHLAFACGLVAAAHNACVG